MTNDDAIQRFAEKVREFEKSFRNWPQDCLLENALDNIELLIERRLHRETVLEEAKRVRRALKELIRRYSEEEERRKEKPSATVLQLVPDTDGDKPSD